MFDAIEATEQERENLQAQGQNIRRLASLSSALAAIVCIFYLYLTLSQGDWRYAILIALFLLIIPASIWVMRLNNAGRQIQAAWALIGIICLASLGTTTIIANVGSALGTVALVLVVFIAIQTLPSRLLTRAIGISAIVALILSALDVLIPYQRIATEAIEQFSTFIILASVAGFLLLAVTQFKNLRLTNKILVTYLGIAALISLTFTFVASAIFTSVLSARAGENLALVAQSRGQALGSILDQQIDAIAALTTDEDIQLQIARINRAHDPDVKKEMERISRINALWQQADAANNNEHPVINGRLYNIAASRLRKFQDTFPNHAALIVTDNLGGIVATTYRPPDYYQATQTWWQVAYNNGTGGIYIGTPEYDEDLGLNVIRFAIPVRDLDTGNIIGVLQSNYAIQGFQGLISQPVGQTGSTEFVFLSETPVRLKSSGLQPASPELVRDLQSLPARNYTEINLDRTNRILSIAPVASLAGKTAVNDLAWNAIVYQSKTEILEAARQQVRIIQLLGTLLSAVVTILAIVIAQQLSRPVLSLNESIKQFQAGNLTVQADIISKDEIGYLAVAFNELTAQIREMLAGLEQRVAERTMELQQAVRKIEERAQALELVSEVAKVAASQQQLESLLNLVTTLVSEKFSFYHVGIFLLDENREYAILRAANSPGGKRMLQRHHRLRVGQVGIVGNVAATGQPRIALDVGEDAVFFDNPDLPDTRSEAALPLRSGNQVIGILDVQSVKASAFSEEDIKVLGILADQVAIAIDNARLVADLQQALLEAKTLQQQYMVQAWKNVTTRKYLGYHRTLAEGKPITQLIQRAEIVQALKSGKFVTIYPQDSKKETELPALAIPIRIRDQAIGVLNLRSQDPNRRWSEEEISLLSSIADRLALALENARLFEETTRRAVRERTVSEITTKIRSKTDPESMIQTALAELQQVLGVSRVEILPYRPEMSSDAKRQTNK